MKQFLPLIGIFMLFFLMLSGFAHAQDLGKAGKGSASANTYEMMWALPQGH